MSHLPNLLAAAVGPPDLGLRSVWLAITLLGAFVIALVAGVLKWVAMRQAPTAVASPTSGAAAIAVAVLYAGTASAGAVGVLLAIYYFLVR